MNNRRHFVDRYMPKWYARGELAALRLAVFRQGPSVSGLTALPLVVGLVFLLVTLWIAFV